MVLGPCSQRYSEGPAVWSNFYHYFFPEGPASFIGTLLMKVAAERGVILSVLMSSDVAVDVGPGDVGNFTCECNA